MGHKEDSSLAQSQPSRIATLEDLPLPGALIAADGVLLDANDLYCAAFGFERDRVVGTSIFDRLDADLVERTRAAFAALTLSSPNWTSPAQLLNLHGRERRRIFQGTGHFDEEGRLETMMLVFWDVTEEYRYNETLEDLIRITNDRSLDTTDVIKGILAIGHAYFSMSAGTITRYAEEGVYAEFRIRENLVKQGELIPHELAYASITHSRGNIVAIQDLDKTEYADAPFRSRIYMRSFLSAEIYVDGALYGALSFASPEARTEPFSNEDVQLIRILAQWLSYALLRRSKMEELGASEERYRFIYQNSPIMMHTVGEDLTISNVNRTWLETLGYDRDDVIGRPLLDFFSEASREEMRAVIERRVALPLVNAPRTMLRADGTVVEVEASTLSEPDASPLSVLTVLNNVTDRNRAQRSLARLNEGLRRTNEGLKRFNAIAAHDLQEPLRKIRLFSDVLEETLGDSDAPEIREPLTVIRRSSDRLSKLVSDLQTYTRETQRSFQRVPIDLNRLLGDVLERLAPPESVRITIIDPLPQVAGDLTALDKLFTNLLANAIAEHSPKRPAVVLMFGEAKADGGARLTIRDNGTKPPTDRADRIFEAFSGPGRNDNGTDTSLNRAIAKSIVEAHGWEMRAEAAPDGEGTDFVIEIPPHQIIRRSVPDHA